MYHDLTHLRFTDLLRERKTVLTVDRGQELGMATELYQLLRGFHLVTVSGQVIGPDVGVKQFLVLLPAADDEVRTKTVRRRFFTNSRVRARYDIQAVLIAVRNAAGFTVIYIAVKAIFRTDTLHSITHLLQLSLRLNIHGFRLHL